MSVSILRGLALACLAPWLSAQNYFTPDAPIPELNPAGTSNFSPTLSTDELYMVFSSTRAGGLGGYDLYETSRASVLVPWSPPVNVTVLNSTGQDYEPNLTVDGLTLFFISTRAGGLGSSDIYTSTRPTTSSPWGVPVNLGAPLNAAGIVNDDPYLTEDQLTIFYTAGGAGGADIWTSSRPAIGMPFAVPVPFAPANSGQFDHSATVEGNGDVIFFSSTRPTVPVGSTDFYMVIRDPVTATYGAAIPINEMSTADWDSNAAIGRTTGAMYVSQFVGANSAIVQLCNTVPPVTIPSNPTIDMVEQITLGAPARESWRRSYSSSITVPLVQVKTRRCVPAGAAGRVDVLLASFSLISPPVPANFILPGALGAISLGSPNVTLSLAVIAPGLKADVQTGTLAVPPNPAFIGMLLHLQGAELDVGPSLLRLTQPASLLLTP